MRKLFKRLREKLSKEAQERVAERTEEMLKALKTEPDRVRSGRELLKKF